MRLAENTGRKNYAKNRHLRTIAQLLSGNIFAIKARIDIQKKNLLNGNISSIFFYNMMNFGPLKAEICWRVGGTPANFNEFCILAALLVGYIVWFDRSLAYLVQFSSRI